LSDKKEPYELYPTIWKNSSSFFTYLRGAIRSIWSRFPAKLEWKKQQLVDPPKGYTGRAKKLGECHYCKEMFPASRLEVDHVEMAGKCNSWETANEFLYKLLDCNDNWVLACKPCHKCKSLAERKGISFEEALLQKRVIEICKKPKQEILAFLQERGYTGDQISNAAKRRKCVEDELRKQHESRR
jgi:5-methylcytosine-specific restriction endonuclease McrA